MDLTEAAKAAAEREQAAQDKKLADEVDLHQSLKEAAEATKDARLAATRASFEASITSFLTKLDTSLVATNITITSAKYQELFIVTRVWGKFCVSDYHFVGRQIEYWRPQTGQVDLRTFTFRSIYDKRWSQITSAKDLAASLARYDRWAKRPRVIRWLARYF